MWSQKTTEKPSQFVNSGIWVVNQINPNHCVAVYYSIWLITGMFSIEHLLSGPSLGSIGHQTIDTGHTGPRSGCFPGLWSSAPSSGVDAWHPAPSSAPHCRSHLCMLTPTCCSWAVHTLQHFLGESGCYIVIVVDTICPPDHNVMEV